ncbi:hypothetical protein BB561_004097 [Smittium simulii]|uniref:CCHC-type domain-containing protein n=1 Tax=Smittium simulii TaxID=133385 RepID=A0A2T9YHY4_9FUNG|nr:hypothetical protein BB561_004097 [Smittium simulii]
MNLFDAFAILDLKRQVANLKLQLRGTAETTLESYVIKNSNQDFTSPKDFYDSLAALFIDPSFPQVLRRKLQQLKQVGSLADYISAEANLIGDFKGISDKERIYLFKYGLENRYVNILNLRNPGTFIEAIALISSHGTAIDMRIAQNNVKDSMSMDIDFVNNIETKKNDNKNEFILIDNSYDINTFLYNIKGMEIPINVATTSGKSYLNKNLVCWNCGTPGHRLFECTKSQIKKSSTNTTTDYLDIPDSEFDLDFKNILNSKNYHLTPSNLPLNPSNSQLTSNFNDIKNEINKKKNRKY